VSLQLKRMLFMTALYAFIAYGVYFAWSKHGTIPWSIWLYAGAGIIAKIVWHLKSRAAASALRAD
jgi:hypothetical protein